MTGAARHPIAVPEYADTLKPTASRFAFLTMIDVLAVASAYKLDGSAHETVRRIKYNAQIHRTGKEMEPLGD
ncbi:hypothetical protein [Mesorhizobium sp. B2-3-11]|uniref:hypothetical protein n=1 Tax=Mesorhizobium sp. B2-3-11 TaxID=2589953 RepID=UPI001FF045AC|nr:hypothetical protein [Mesorhizobium sp. B2-3-11]